MAGNKKEYSLGFMIGAQLKSSFSSAFKGAEKQLLSAQKAAKNCKAAWADFGQQAGKLVLGVTGVAAGVTAAIWKMTDSVAQAGDAAAKDAAAVKMETEAFQELQYAYGQAGVGADEFTSMVTKMNSTLAKAAKDDSAAAALAEYGLSAEKLARMAPENALMRLSDYFLAIEDPLERSRLSMTLFGNSSAAMEAAMLQGSEGIQTLREEARTTGWVISDAAARQAEAYGDAKDRLAKSVEGMRRQLFGPAMGAFTEFFAIVSDRLAEHMPTVEGLGAKLGEALINALPKMIEFGKGVRDFALNIWDAVQRVKDFVGGWKNLGVLVLAISQIKTITSGVMALASTFKMLKSGIGLVSKMFPALGKAGLGALGPALPIILAIAAAAFLIYKNWDKLKPLFQRIMDTLKGAWDRVWPKIKAAAARIQPAVDKIGDAIAAVLEFVMPLFEAAIDFIATVIENAFDLIGPLFDFVAALVTFFCDLVTGNWEALGEDIRAIIDAIKNLWKAAFDAAKNIVKKFVSTVLNLFQPVTDFFKGIGDKIASIFGGKKTLEVETIIDGQTTANAIPQYATGGIFHRPHLAQIAEAGDAEAVVPINSNPRSRAIWETAGRLAGFLPEDEGGAGAFQRLQTARTANITGDPRDPGGKLELNVSIPIHISGNATADTVAQLKEAAGDFAGIVREQVEAVIAERNRYEARVRY